MTPPRHDPKHLQLPIEAVKVWLDLAVNTMNQNDGINLDDWIWFLNTVGEMKDTALFDFMEWKRKKGLIP